MRRLIPAAAAAAALAIPAVTAHAADTTVQVKDDFFDAKSVTVNVGDSVTWNAALGAMDPHNVKANDGSFKLGGNAASHDPAPGPWSGSFTFKKAGVFGYYCEQHGAKDGSGMAGKVVVRDPNDHTPPKVSNLRTNPSKFCTNKTKNCHKRGTRVRFTLSEAAKVRADAVRKGHSRKAFEKQLGSGKQTVKFSGHGLKPGRYTLKVRATDASGNTSKTYTTKFRVKKKG